LFKRASTTTPSAGCSICDRYEAPILRSRFICINRGNAVRGVRHTGGSCLFGSETVAATVFSRAQATRTPPIISRYECVLPSGRTAHEHQDETLQGPEGWRCARFAGDGPQKGCSCACLAVGPGEWPWTRAGPRVR
jgi:hypothetical protein